MEPSVIERIRKAKGKSLLLILALGVSLACDCANWRQVFAVPGQVVFADADCYARMTRVRDICAHPGEIIRGHAFENYPFGTQSHTTAPLDYMIWALRGSFNLIHLFHGGDTLDLAGAWASPLLGLVMIGGIWWWAIRERLRGSWLMLLILAASPMIAHCFDLGRPDHQSLVLACVAWALAAEWAQWRAPSRGWGIIGGVAWGLGLWTSLYEPVITLALVWLAGAIFHRGALFRRERLPGLGVAAAILAIAFALEGWRIEGVPGFGAAADASAFEAWSHQIAELAHVSPLSSLLYSWTGLGLLASPVLLLLVREPSDRPAARAHLLLIAAMFALTCWQERWGYFLPLVYAMSLPSQLGAVAPRWRPLASGLLVLGLWPMASAWWDAQSARHEADMAFRTVISQRQSALPPLVSEDQRRTEELARPGVEMVDLRQAADVISRDEATAPHPPHPPVAPLATDADEPAGILAPWWLSPALAYWSGQPALAGSSHESLPGIVDTSKFYLDADIPEVAAILRRRRVRWIVAYDPDRVLATAGSLLDRPTASARCMAIVLYRGPDLARGPDLTPRFLRLVLANPSFKVYEVRADLLPTSP